MAQNQILLVIDEPGTVKILTTVLKTEGYKVLPSTGLADAVATATTGEIGLLIVDVAGMDAAKLGEVKHLKAMKPASAMILLSGKDQTFAPLDDDDVFASFAKPFKMDALLSAVQHAMDFSEKAMAEVSKLKMQIETAYQFDDIIAESPGMRGVCEMINRIAATEVNVLVSGETGTGKAMVASSIHRHSLRKDRKFVAVDCRKSDTGLPEERIFGKGETAGAFEEAAGGTIFLAGVDSLSIPAQAKLLSALKDRETTRIGTGARVYKIEARIVASVGAPEGAVRAGRLNPELYALLRVISIMVPPLRDRRADIASLVNRIIFRVSSGKAGISVDGDAMEVLKSYRWPGNARQLEEVLQQAYAGLKGDRITLASLPDFVKAS